MTILHASQLTAHDLRLLGNNLAPRRHERPEPNEPLKPARDTPEPAEKQPPPSPAKPEPMELPPAAWQRD